MQQQPGIEFGTHEYLVGNDGKITIRSDISITDKNLNKTTAKVERSFYWPQKITTTRDKSGEAVQCIGNKELLKLAAFMLDEIEVHYGLGQHKVIPDDAMRKEGIVDAGGKTTEVFDATTSKVTRLALHTIDPKKDQQNAVDFENCKKALSELAKNPEFVNPHVRLAGLQKFCKDNKAKLQLEAAFPYRHALLDEMRNTQAEIIMKPKTSAPLIMFVTVSNYEDAISKQLKKSLDTVKGPGFTYQKPESEERALLEELYSHSKDAASTNFHDTPLWLGKTEPSELVVSKELKEERYQTLLRLEDDLENVSDLWIEYSPKQRETALKNLQKLQKDLEVEGFGRYGKISSPKWEKVPSKAEKSPEAPKAKDIESLQQQVGEPLILLKKAPFPLSAFGTVEPETTAMPQPLVQEPSYKLAMIPETPQEIVQEPAQQLGKQEHPRKKIEPLVVPDHSAEVEKLFAEAETISSQKPRESEKISSQEYLKLVKDQTTAFAPLTKEPLPAQETTAKKAKKAKEAAEGAEELIQIDEAIKKQDTNVQQMTQVAVPPLIIAPIKERPQAVVGFRAQRPQTPIKDRVADAKKEFAKAVADYKELEKQLIGVQNQITSSAKVSVGSDANKKALQSLRDQARALQQKVVDAAFQQTNARKELDAAERAAGLTSPKTAKTPPRPKPQTPITQQGSLPKQPSKPPAQAISSTSAKQVVRPPSPRRQLPQPPAQPETPIIQRPPLRSTVKAPQMQIPPSAVPIKIKLRSALSPRPGQPQASPTTPKNVPQPAKQKTLAPTVQAQPQQAQPKTPPTTPRNVPPKGKLLTAPSVEKTQQPATMQKTPPQPKAPGPSVPQKPVMAQPLQKTPAQSSKSQAHPPILKKLVLPKTDLEPQGKPPTETKLTPEEIILARRAAIKGVEEE